MGTNFRLVFFAPTSEVADKAARSAFQRIRDLDQIMSDYREDSELMKLSRSAGGPPLKVSRDLWFVLTRAQELARKTDGAFDVSIGPLTRLWRRARRQKELPAPERIDAARSLVGYANVQLMEATREVRLLKAGMQLDLGGIAKGHAADEALALLREQGISSAMVVAGGDVATADPPPGRDGWLVTIAPLAATGTSSARQLCLKRAAVSTSGDAEQYLELAGRRYSHVIDPRTGWPREGRSATTVVAPSATDSDSLATAVNVMGPAKGMALVDAWPGAAALHAEVVPEGRREAFSRSWESLRFVNHE